MTNSIRALQAQKEQLLREYQEQTRQIDEQIAAIRAARGTKLRTYDMADYFEVGRAREPSTDRI